MLNSYAAIDVETASPVALVARLYAAAIRHTRAARDAGDDARTRGRSASRALDILGELRQSLSMEQGGEIARNLDALYEFTSDRIVDGTRGRRGAFDEALRVLEPLGEAWDEIARGPAAAAAEAPTP